MNIQKIIVAVILLITLAVYSNRFTWFSPAEASDTAPLEIKARAGGIALVSGAANQVTLPANITFTANEPATIYYTTNGTDPTTATPTFSKIVTSGYAATGPTINGIDSILVTLGEDAAGNLTSVKSYTFFTP